MPILLIVALVLAIPTFGLSVLAWLVLAWVNGQKKVADIQRMQRIRENIEPYFQGKFAQFILSLDLPMNGYQVQLTQEEAHQCGIHLVNYIAHNPSETREFVGALNELSESIHSHDPCLALVGFGNRMPLVGLRGVLAVMTNNPGIACFSKIDAQNVQARINRLSRDK